MFGLGEYLADRLDKIINRRVIPPHPDGEKSTTYDDLRDETNFDSDLTEEQMWVTVGYRGTRRPMHPESWTCRCPLPCPPLPEILVAGIGVLTNL